MLIKAYPKIIITTPLHHPFFNITAPYSRMFYHPRLIHLRKWPLKHIWATLGMMFTSCLSLNIHKRRRRSTHPRFNIQARFHYNHRPHAKFNLKLWINLLHFTRFFNKKIIFTLLLLNLMLSYGYLDPYIYYFTHLHNKRKS